MSDPYGPSGRQDAEPTQSAYPYPPYTDPAYAGQTPAYGPGYPPAYGSGPTGQSPQQHWGHGGPPPTRIPPAGGGEPPPPEPPKSPRWLWLLTGAAVLLVVGLVIALVLANGSTDKSATVSPFPPTPSTKAGTPAPPTTTSQPPSTSPPGTTGTGATDSVVYNVTGQGRAISIIYVDADDVVQSEFNVPLPWSKQVNLPSSASQPASVSVANIGEDVTCSVTVNGRQVSERTGSILTICTSAR
jgi:hypothetical protein